MSWRWTADDARYVVENSDAELLVAHARFADVAVASSVSIPPERRLAVGGAIPGFRDYHELVDPFAASELDHPLAGDTMLYTSGTTGRPKGVLRPPVDDSRPPGRAGRSGMQMIRTYLPVRMKWQLVGIPLVVGGVCESDQASGTTRPVPEGDSSCCDNSGSVTGLLHGTCVPAPSAEKRGGCGHRRFSASGGGWGRHASRCERGRRGRHERRVARGGVVPDDC